MRKVAPAPGALSTSMWPWLWVTAAYTVDSPRPVPLSFSLVVKKGSKICSRTSSGMPVPVSETSRRT